MSDHGTTRRDLFKLGAATAAGLIAARLGAEAVTEPVTLIPAPKAPFNPATAMAMPTRNLGRTGHLVGLFSLGGRQPSSNRTTTGWPFHSSSGPWIWV